MVFNTSRTNFVNKRFKIGFNVLDFTLHTRLKKEIKAGLESKRLINSASKAATLLTGNLSKNPKDPANKLDKIQCTSYGL